MLIFLVNAEYHAHLTASTKVHIPFQWPLTYDILALLRFIIAQFLKSK